VSSEARVKTLSVIISETFTIYQRFRVRLKTFP
jgi:hypothetical protein